MSITKKKFGMIEDKEVYLYTLKNKNGMEAAFIDYGAILVRLYVPDKNGKLEDVVLGYENIEGYLQNAPGFGSLIGRHANRIANAKFELNGITYTLEKNDGENNLHGGSVGFNKVMYETETFEEEDSDSIEFSRLSPDMEQGFPGNLDISMTYTLTEENELVLEYLAVSDQDTIVNLTNHSYFNLSGHDSGSVLSQKVMIHADKFTPTSDDLIPTGELVDVAGTPMDFRKLKPIGQDIDAEYYPLKQANGYDHNYCLNITGNEVEKVAELVDEKSGRKMEVFTDMPGMQLYTANSLSMDPNYKKGADYKDRDGVCFETQYYPNSTNMKQFPTPVLKAGVEYDHVTVYKFSVI